MRSTIVREATFRVCTTDYQASTDLFHFAVRATLHLPPLHPMLTDPDVAHLRLLYFVEPASDRTIARIS